MSSKINREEDKASNAYKDQIRAIDLLATKGQLQTKMLRK